jgi:hypothetical protein
MQPSPGPIPQPSVAACSFLRPSGGISGYFIPYQLGKPGAAYSLAGVMGGGRGAWLVVNGSLKPGYGDHVLFAAS